MSHLEHPFVRPVFRFPAQPNDKRRFLGTGFLVAPDLLITCRHVCKSGTTFLVGANTTAELIEPAKSITKYRDVALLKLAVAETEIEPPRLLVGLRKDEPKMAWVERQMLRTVGYPQGPTALLRIIPG